MSHLFAAQPPLVQSGICFNKGDQKNRHAEIIFLEDVIGREMNSNLLSATDGIGAGTGRKAVLPGCGGVITLMMNLSPCGDCARQLCNLIEVNPHFKIIIHFLKLYKCTYNNPKREENIRALQMLRSHPSIDLDVMTNEEYDNLVGPYVDITTKAGLEKIVTVNPDDFELGLINKLDALFV